MPRLLQILMTSLALAAQSATADPVAFNDWRQHWFARFADVDFDYSQKTMGVQANGAVSITYKLLDPSLSNSTAARWDWSVSDTVAPTDLRKKGGDDRNLALYFAFLPEKKAKATRSGGNLRKLLKNPDGRVLAYVWGGNHKRNAILPSPYLGARGKTIVLRSSGKGAYSEKIDLLADYRRAFKSDPGALVALAVSADSDDTDAVIRGKISNLFLLETASID